MGVGDQYLRHLPDSNNHLFGVISSIRAHPIWLPNGKVIITARCETVVAWNLKTATVIAEFLGSGGSPASAISLQDQFLAVGYGNGEIRVFSLEGFSMKANDTIQRIPADTVFNGHSNEITCLNFSNYSETELYLASGSIDTNVIVWDVLGEKGIAKFTPHKAHITSVSFCKNKPSLITSSVDSTLKIFDVETKHCFYTLLNHKHEIRQIAIIEETESEILFCTGSKSSAELRFFSYNYDTNEANEIGKIVRSCADNVRKIVYNYGILAAIGNGKNCDIWRLLNKEEREKRLKKRQKKAEKKISANVSKEEMDKIREGVVKHETYPIKLDFGDKFETVQTVYATQATRGLSLNFVPNKENDKIASCKVMFLLKDNKFEFWQGEVACDSKFEQVAKFSLPGHRAEPKMITIGSDDTVIATAGRGEVKIWNRISGKCLRTLYLETEDNKKLDAYPTCIMWAPGDKHILVGMKSGSIQIWHIASGKLIEKLDDAHSDSVWGMIKTRKFDGKSSKAVYVNGFTTCGSDKMIGFFEFDMNDNGHIIPVHNESLEMDEECLALDYKMVQTTASKSIY